MNNHLYTIVVLLLICFGGIFGYYFFIQMNWERNTREQYRMIKASMKQNFFDRQAAFLNIWDFSQELPEITFINFHEDQNISLYIDRRNISFSSEPKFFAREIAIPILLPDLLPESDTSITTNNDTSIIIHPEVFNLYLGNSEGDSLFQVLNPQRQIMAYFSELDTIIELKENYYLRYHGTPTSNEFEEVLYLAGLTKSQIWELRDKLKGTGVSEGFRKDKSGNIFLGYWAFLGEGAFEYVMPQSQYEWRENVFEFGVIDQYLGVFWHYGERQLEDGIVCLSRPLIIVD
ncbi:MAG: hypothetical protein R3B93_25375 [Bacteroidia bacterium]